MSSLDALPAALEAGEFHEITSVVVERSGEGVSSYEGELGLGAHRVVCISKRGWHAVSDPGEL